MSPKPHITRDLISAFISSKQRSRRASSTIANYSRVLAPFAFTFERLPLDPSQIEQFLERFIELSDQTYAHYFRLLGIFYRWLARRGYIAGPDDPFEYLDPPRVKRKLPRVLTAAELRQAIEATHPESERALLLVGCTKDDLVDGGLRVSGKTGERMVFLSRPVLAYLRELSTFYLFPRHRAFGHGASREIIDAPASGDTLAQHVRRVLTRSGLTGPKLGPHVLRHTFATMFLRRSHDLYALKEMLGHTSVKSTEIYLNFDIEELSALHDQFSPLALMMTAHAVTPTRKLPKVRLPDEALAAPLLANDGPVCLMFVSDRRPGRTWYYIRARAGRLRWQVANLGNDLPLETVDAYRQAVQEENRRRDRVRMRRR